MLMDLRDARAKPAITTPFAHAIYFSKRAHCSIGIGLQNRKP